MIALVITLWWGSHWMSRAKARKLTPRPITRAMLVFSAAVLLSYVAASTRAIDVLERNAADRVLLSLFGWLGIVLIAGTLIPVRKRLDTLLRRTVTFGGMVATLGIAQFVTGRGFTEYLKLPGLSENEDLTSVLSREGLNRAAGTATHPIEFGVVITMILPIALHYALRDQDRPPWRRWAPVLLILLAIPASVSRTSILCAMVVTAFLLPTWEKRWRRLSYLALAGLTGAVFVAVPGMLGTLLQMFTGISNDPSARSRTDSYAVSWEFISGSPFFGRGLATFLPSYRILDNQYLMSVIEIGFFGLFALLGLLGTGIIVGLLVRKRSEDPSTRSLALSLSASLAAGSVSFAFFDALSFSMISGMMFFVLGMINTMYHLESEEGSRIASDVSQSALSPSTGAFAIAALQLDPTDLSQGKEPIRSVRHARSDSV
jgi:O-antigen ligase